MNRVDLLLRRSDFDAAGRALTSAGFVRAEVAGVTTFLDGPDGGARAAVRVIVAGERARPSDLVVSPDVTESVAGRHFQIVVLESLVRMELSLFGREQAMNLRDLLDVGLIDASWPARFPPELAARLQLLIDTPEG